jgi:hypothetical protein
MHSISTQHQHIHMQLDNAATTALCAQSTATSALLPLFNATCFVVPCCCRLLLTQALDKAFDTQADVCKAMREVQFDQQLLNKVCCTATACLFVVGCWVVGHSTACLAPLTAHV